MPGDVRRSGKELERLAHAYLGLTGVRVQAEIMVAGKKVDLLFEDEKFGHTEIVAVECKDHSGVRVMKLLPVCEAEETGMHP